MAKKEEKESKKSSSYSAKDIFVLEGLEPVRKRPGMYIGSTGPDGLHHLIWEIVDNSIDEAMAGHATHIKVELLKEGMVAVTDDGRGIPVDIHPQTKKSALETALCTLHAGGKFGGDSYKVSGGLHGVGVSVVNALSTHLKAEITRDGGLYMQEYKTGVPQYKVKKVKDAKGSGTKITFQADSTIFSKIEFDKRKILDRLRQQAYLIKGVHIEFVDERGEAPMFYGFYFDGGLRSFLRHMTDEDEVLHDNEFYIHKTYEDIEVESAILYINDTDIQELSFANNINTPDGGTHITGLRSALTRTLNDFARKEGFIKESDENLTGDDVREGMVAAVAVRLREPQFEGQTKARLGNTEARTAVEMVVSEALKEYLEKNPQDAKKIIEKNLLAAKARRAAKAAKETVLRKSVLDGLSLPGKLADCISRKAEESEVFIVEGDSAGGSAKQGRDRRFQAILPLRGKILNVEKSRIDKMLANKEIRSLVIAMGTAISDSFDISKLRYHKIVIMTDADVDGGHIRTLLLTLFYRHFIKVIEGGYLYIAQPPLYRVARGKEVRYAYTEEERDAYVKTLGENANIQRYKGLGEMNPSQLWETTMDPAVRVLRQVSVEDAVAADRMLDMLMGEVVEPRKKFIFSHATSVKDLDI